MKSNEVNMKVAILFFLTLVCSISSYAQTKNWVAPASANKLINPYKENVEAVNSGKVTFDAMCVICHGVKGKGNGAASVSLTTPPANFLSIEVRDETDGAIFWKLSEGNPPMASYKTMLTEKQRWEVVNYIRHLESSPK